MSVDERLGQMRADERRSGLVWSGRRRFTTKTAGQNAATGRATKTTSFKVHRTLLATATNSASESTTMTPSNTGRTARCSSNHDAAGSPSPKVPGNDPTAPPLAPRRDCVVHISTVVHKMKISRTGAVSPSVT